MPPEKWGRGVFSGVNGIRRQPSGISKRQRFKSFTNGKLTTTGKRRDICRWICLGSLILTVHLNGEKGGERKMEEKKKKFIIIFI